MDNNTLIQKAVEAKKNAHPPYSNFHVGAALLTEDDKIYTGCNVENSTFGLTLCAERTAIFKAMSEGERKFKAIAIASDSPDYITPCGACRQIISDHCGEIDIICTNAKGEYKIFKTSELLPHAFGDKDLNK
ncbi:MAG TPA: cytidine deaminase [Ignavibacteriaceae bacterium]|jgi:cytidine deaminase|nr:MAG: cytidine deaminase [Ignavibacteriales bacterium UTCHB2]HQF41979.1 cytidine deaminase [Ignavibacteriaceae bacterium]HQI40843.1 cytidine deaminase [Ignavibacteriaceae bacterium]